MSESQTWGEVADAAPKGKDQFLKFKSGDTKFRILSPPVTGYLAWTEDNKPVRWQDEPSKEDLEEENIRENDKGKVECKYFLLLGVWDYENQQVKALEVTQKSVWKDILGYATEEDWGDPTGYDFTVNKTGDGLGTKYAVKPHPKKALPKAVLDAVEEVEYDLSLVFEGEYPFD